MNKENIGDFFRKRLESNDSNESWANPNSDIDKLLIDKISTYDYTKSIGLKSFILKSFGFLILSPLLIYCFVLNNKLSKINKSFDEFKINSVLSLSKLDSQLNAKAQEILNRDSLNQVLKSNIKIFRQENNFLNSKLNKANINLSENYQRLKKLKEKYNDTIFQNNKQKTFSEVKLDNKPKINSQRLLSLLPHKISHLSSLNSRPFVLNLESGIVPYKERLKRFSIGYEVNSREWIFSSTISIPEQTIISDNESIDRKSFMFHGPSLRYNINKRLAIVSGFRYGIFTMASVGNLILEYDTSNEEEITVNQDRILVNNLKVENSNPFISRQFDIPISYDYVDRLESGEILDLEFIDTMSLHLFQIPIGLEYLLLKGKLNSFVGIGIAINTLTVRDHSFTSKFFDSENRNVDVLEERIKALNYNQDIFTEAYVEFGIEYPFLRNTYIRGSALYNYKIGKYNPGFSTNGTTLKVGLNFYIR